MCLSICSMSHFRLNVLIWFQPQLIFYMKASFIMITIMGTIASANMWLQIQVSNYIMFSCSIIFFYCSIALYTLELNTIVSQHKTNSITCIIRIMFHNEFRIAVLLINRDQRHSSKNVPSSGSLLLIFNLLKQEYNFTTNKWVT